MNGEDKIRKEFGKNCKACGHAAGAHARHETELDDASGALDISCTKEGCSCIEFRD